MRGDTICSTSKVRFYAGWVLVAMLVGGFVPAVQAQLTPGNVVALKVQQSGGSTANAGTVTLVEFTPSGTAIGTYTVSTSGASALTLKLSATTEGLLSQTPDGKYISFAGYRADLGTANPGTSTTINRAIGRLDTTTGLFDTSTDFLAFTGDSVRGAATTNGTDYYITGASSTTDGGIRYLPAANYGTSNATTYQLNKSGSTAPNGRGVVIYDGQLYMSSATSVASGGPGVGIHRVGTGTPTPSADTTVTFSNLTQFTGSQGFFFADLSDTVGYSGGTADTLYVSNSTSIGKFTFDGTSWVASGTAASSASVLGIDGTKSGATVTLYGALATSNAQLITLTDTSGYAGTINGSVTSFGAAAGASTQWRGVAVLVPEPVHVGLLALAASSVFRRPRRARLAI